MVKDFKKINIKNNWQELLLTLGALIYSVYFSIASFLRYDNFYTGRFDLGNMSQTVWNTIHGNIFQLTNPNGTESISRLAFHADFILILLSPFYLLWENPKMLLLIQTLVLATGSFFVYAISKEVLKNKNISLVIAFCYLLNPAVNYTNLFEFHGVTLATTFLLAGFYFLIKKYYKLMLLFLILAGITKEQVWAITALIGLYLAIFKKEKTLGLAITAMSAFMFYILVFIAIPRALGNQHFALSYYSEFGDSPLKIIKNIIFSPKKTLEIALLPDRLGYVRQLFLPLGYLSIFAPLFLVFALPDLTIDLLSNNSTLHQIYYQYSSTVTPFIFISLIYGVSRIRKRFPEVTFGILGTIIFILTLASARDYGPLPFAKKPNTSMFTNHLAIRSTVDHYISSIPFSESISATNNLGSHLSHRKNIYTLPLGIEKANTILFLLNNSTNIHERNALKQIQSDPDSYKLVLHEQNFYVFKKMSL